MCGLAAAIDWPEAEAAVAQITRLQRHRGEVDDPLISPFRGYALQTRRLRIVDPDGGRQPKASQDGRILVAMNGEIYNHRELRADLEGRGIAARTGSDTEVLADALQVFGPAALPRLRGMYAFVALDLSTREVLAARDPFGEKPLYVVQEGGGLLFASEIRPLLAAATGDVLLLPPGTLLTRRGVRPHFQLPAAPGALDRSDPEALLEALRRAVRLATPDDLATGLFFSGGVDSTLVAALAREVRPDLRAYSLAGGPDGASPDLPFARLYAEASGLELQEVPGWGDERALLAAFDAAVETCESFEPTVVRPALCSQALAAAAAADGLKVALTGEGADELFAGYRVMEVAYAADPAAGEAVRAQTLSNLGRSALQRVDRTAMAVRLEARSPFLDRDLALGALSLGPGALLRAFAGGEQGKAPLRALFDGLGLPAAIRDRDKRPLNEGGGLDRGPGDSPLKALIEARVSAADFADGRRRWADYDLGSAEELYALERLAATMDVARVPHLKGRLRIAVPGSVPLEPLRAYA